MKIKLFLLTFMFFCDSSFGQLIPELRNVDKIRIKEAMTISAKFGEKLYKGYSSVPFAMVLITDSIEFLINHPNPSSDFKLLGYDNVLSTNIYYRKTQFNPQFLATFPAVNGLSCIVAGTPENTNKNSTDWVITLLHEHLHQYQNAYPDYFKSVNDLNLSGGDKTGMWMLNYPFPYEDLNVIQQYEKYSKSLYETVTNLDSKYYKSKLRNYFVERKKLKDLLSEKDYRYFSFQIWQEGIARYTEYKFLQMLENHQPSVEMLALPDFMEYSKLKSKMYQDETNNLLLNKLNEAQRVALYSIGFAEGLLLDKLNNNWRKKYLTEKFYIEQYSNKYN